MSNDPTLLDQMAASAPTRWTFGALVSVLVAVGCFLAWHAGVVHATDARFEALEAAVHEARGERREIAIDSREVYSRLIVIETRLVAMDEGIERMRADVIAIRDAVAPLPRAKDGE